MASVPVRRIVTGHDPQGNAIIISDNPTPYIRSFDSIPGVYFSEIWATREVPAKIDNGADPTPELKQLVPWSHGSIIRIVDIPPESALKPMDPATAKAHFAEMGSPEVSTAAGESKYLMHRTETIDYGIVLEGEITLVLDKGEVDLRQGDIVVQRGTNHAWSNRSGKLCRIVFILLDGKYSGDVKSALERRG